MPFTLLQVGNVLAAVNPAGNLAIGELPGVGSTDGGPILVPLLLPVGITLAMNRTPRFARLNRYIVLVNTPSRPISIDPNGFVRVLTPLPPASAPVMTAGAAGGLTGDFLALQTYFIADSLGNTISESDYSVIVTTPTSVTAQKLAVAYATSPDAVSGSRFYRTAVGPTQDYFHWLDSSDNRATSFQSDMPDASLGLLPGPPLGSAPDLTLICEWGGRLWGVDRIDVDDLRYTEAGTMYAWSGFNTLPIQHVGTDAVGITALIPRRDALGVAKLHTFVQVTGTDTSTIAPTTLSEECGCVSQESAVVFNDVAYFLWQDGVYQWNANGLSSITDGSVRSWFTTDQYFNRTAFWRSFAEFDPVRLKYKLFLASAGSSIIDRWIEYDITTGKWWGPHVTTAFQPISAFQVIGSNQKPYFMVGSQEGYLSLEGETKNDWDASPIAMDVQVLPNPVGAPTMNKYFGELVLHTDTEPAGTLTIIPTVGELNAAPDPPLEHDLTQPYERLDRLGEGPFMSLRFQNSESNQDVVINGFEVPYHVTVQR